MNPPERPEIIDFLIEEASRYIGVIEEGGDNRGPDVEMFQRAVDGRAQGEAWCMSALQFWLMETERQFDITSGVFPSEHCLTVWNRTPVSRRFKHPQKGDIIIYQYFKNDRPTSSGHTGLVKEVLGSSIITVEGNTGPGTGVEREGDGVYEKKRSIFGSSSMKIVGYIRPF